MKAILLLLCFTFIFTLSKDDIPNYEKYYKPREFTNMDMFSANSKWSFHRYKQSEHFFVFWEAGFGNNPNSNTLKQGMRVNVDDLLLKAEQFYQTNVVKLKFSEVGQGKSILDHYKTEIYILFQEEWLATGAGYDNKVGALWVNPSTCQPVGQVIAHEIGHTFQYIVYCDQILKGETSENAFKSGYRYGYEGSKGGNGFWEQTAQWQSFQNYPTEIFGCWEFPVQWIPHHHRHFEHEIMRYGSYFLHYFWAEKYGIDAVSYVWKNSKYPEDAIMAYMRLFTANKYDVQREELFEYAMRMATYDIDIVREYSGNTEDKYTTQFFQAGGYYQISYENCPGATGFNIIPLSIPTANKEISVEFVGLEPGSAIPAGDPGKWMNGDQQGGSVKNYNSVNKGNVGWRYGFVTKNSDNSRTYSESFSKANGVASFTVPANAKKLFMVVQGSPETYIRSAWDDDERTDAQFPYKVKFTNTAPK